jgi:hypothetical protein
MCAQEVREEKSVLNSLQKHVGEAENWRNRKDIYPLMGTAKLAHSSTDTR